MQDFASTLVAAVGFYAAFGLGFALVFIARGLDALVPGASHGSRGFKLIIVPGCVLLWPLLLARWRVAKRGAA